MTARTRGRKKKPHVVTLQMVADRVGLTKGTCSAVVNKSVASRSVPAHTQERIHAPARELTCRPGFHARNLGRKRTDMLGVLTPEIADSHSSPLSSAVARDV